MEIKDRNFEIVRNEAEEYYKTIDRVTCPYFGEGEQIAFNSKGIKHIKFKSDRVARNRSDQYVRLKHLKFAKRIIEKSRTLQEYSEGQIFDEIKSEHRREKKLVPVKYYGFIAIINDSGRLKRLKIIVKQVGGGEKYFWSIIPFWTSNKQLKMHSGNVEED